MEQLVDKMKEYLNMETEIPYNEFLEYYQQSIDLLQKDFQSMEKNQLVTMAAVIQIVALNAKDRSKTKNDYTKKFKKMAEKGQFWYDALCYKLKKEHSMTQKEIDDEANKLFEDEE